MKVEDNGGVVVVNGQMSNSKSDIPMADAGASQHDLSEHSSLTHGIFSAIHYVFGGISSVFHGSRHQKYFERAALAEHKLLSHLKICQPDNQAVLVKSSMIDIGQERFINTLIIDTTPDKNLDAQAERTLVLCHGYGAGIGMWYRNLDGLAELLPNTRIYVIDWLGMGRSSRNPLPERIKNEPEDADVQKIVDYFVESLEDWRKVCKIEKMFLVGHSMGGYFSANYALRYPERLEKLCLASPAGVPSMEEERLQEFMEHIPPTRRRFFMIAATLWEKGVTPQSFVRSSGLIGQNILKRYATRRFPHATGLESDQLYEYMLAITTIPGAGEFALNRLLRPGAFAKTPLQDKIPKIEVETLFLYGDHDWMGPAVPLEQEKNGVFKRKESRVAIVPNSGHQVFIENPTFFNEEMRKFVME